MTAALATMMCSRFVVNSAVFVCGFHPESFTATNIWTIKLKTTVNIIIKIYDCLWYAQYMIQFEKVTTHKYDVWGSGVVTIKILLLSFVWSAISILINYDYGLLWFWWKFSLNYVILQNRFMSWFHCCSKYFFPKRKKIQCLETMNWHDVACCTMQT